MISKEDRMYFVDPIQTAKVHKAKGDRTPLQLRVMAFKYRRDNFKTERLGGIVPVTHQRVENNELWWVDGDGDYLQGVQLSDRAAGRLPVMAIVNDDLFIVGTNAGEHYNGSRYGSILGSAMRSDGKTLPGATSATWVSQYIVRAAPWARELMPMPGDSEEVVEAKVNVAKQKFTQRQKKGMIYKEGMIRDWLHHLDTLRADHDMPTPTFVIGVNGTYLSPGGDPVPVEELTTVQRDRLNPAIENATIRPDGVRFPDRATQWFGVPFSVVTDQRISSSEELREASSNTMRYSVNDALGLFSGSMVESGRFPILINF